MGHPINRRDAMDAEMNGKEKLCVHRVSAFRRGFREFARAARIPADTNRLQICATTLCVWQSEVSGRQLRIAGGG